MAQENGGTALTIRFTGELYQQVSEFRERMEKDPSRSWSNPTITDAVRLLISLGLERERLLRPPPKRKR